MRRATNGIAWIVMAMALHVALPTVLADQATEGRAAKVEFILAESEPGDGLKEAEVVGSENKPVYLRDKPILTQDDIAGARAIPDAANKYTLIEISFTKAGQEKIAKATTENLNKRLAIVVNGKVISAPHIRTTIASSAHITGNFTANEAATLASRIRPADDK